MNGDAQDAYFLPQEEEGRRYGDKSRLGGKK